VAARKLRIDSARDERSAQLPPNVASKDSHQLAGIARQRTGGLDDIEDDLGEGAHWGMTVGITQAGVRTQLALQHLRLAPDTGAEPGPVIWDAMCRIEKLRQERRDARAACGLRSAVELLGTE
jgi:hypothetical protein